MNIGLYRREHLQSGEPRLIGDATVDQFQRTHGALTAWQEVEHTDDGHHTDIHATSITVDPGGITAEGPITSDDGGFSGEAGNVAVGELPIEGTPGQSGGYGIKIGKWRIISDEQNSPSTPSYPGLIFQYLTETIGNFLFRFIRLGIYDWAFAPQTGVGLSLGWGTNRLSNVVTTKVEALTDVFVGGSPAVVTYRGNQTVATAFQVQGAGIAELQLVDSAGTQPIRLLNYLNTFKVWNDAGGLGELFTVYPTTGAARTRAGLFEYGRGNAQGQRYAWSPLVLTSSGLNCGGSITAFFSITGYQLFWSIYAVNINIPAGSWPYLLVTVPPGFPTVSPFTDQSSMRVYVPGIGDAPGYSQTDTTHIWVYRYGGAAWPGGIGHVLGQGFYWIG